MAISWRKTPSYLLLHPFTGFWYAWPQSCRSWPFMPRDFIGCIIIMETAGEYFAIRFHRAKSNLPFDTLSASFAYGFWERVSWLLLDICLGMGKLRHPFVKWERISADGCRRSSHRRTQLPRFRPAWMSLCCIFWWTLTTTSKMVRVRLQMRKIRS